MVEFKTDYRELRARRFASTVISILYDFLPKQRDCHHAIYEHLYRLAMDGNLAIINVPPEMDKMTKLQLEKAMLERAINTVIQDGTSI